MKSKDLFRELRYWLGVLESATAEVQLDQRMRGPDAWRRNSASFQNQMRMQNSALEGLRLLRMARQRLVDWPSSDDEQALRECESLIRTYLARFETNNPPPTTH